MEYPSLIPQKKMIILHIGLSIQSLRVCVGKAY